MQFTILTEEEFTNFVKEHPTKNFFQTTMMQRHLKKENQETYLVGVKKDKKVIGAAMLSSTNHSFQGTKTFESLKGFILDYEDQELLKFMTEEVIKFLKTKNALRLIIDPYIPHVSRDMDANETEEIDNRHIVKYLENIGYQKTTSPQVKWCYCLDINGQSSDEIFKTFRSSTRNNINKTINKFKLEVKNLTKKELGIFKKITSDTCDRRSFNDKSLAYYEDMYDEFKDDVTFKVVYLNCDKYIDTLKEENANFEAKINELSDGASNKKKKGVMRKDIESNKEKIAETEKIKSENGNLVPLSAAMFILYGDEIVYLFSGSYAKFMSFCGQYRLQWEIIKYAAEKKYRRYNFYGIQDVFNKNGKDYGVYEFKKGFGGYVEELLGPFEIGVSKKYKYYKVLKKIKSILKSQDKNK